MIFFNVISPLWDKGEKSSVPMGPMRRGTTVLHSTEYVNKKTQCCDAPQFAFFGSKELGG